MGSSVSADAEVVRDRLGWLVVDGVRSGVNDGRLPHRVKVVGECVGGVGPSVRCDHDEARAHGLPNEMRERNVAEQENHQVEPVVFRRRHDVEVGRDVAASSQLHRELDPIHELRPIRLRHESEADGDEPLLRRQHSAVLGVQ